MNASLDPSMNVPMGVMPGQIPATSLRSIEQASAPSIGSRINLNPASQAANTAPFSPTTRPAVVTVGSERA